MLATCATVFLLLADAGPVTPEATNPDSRLLFALVFGIGAATLSLFFGWWVTDETTKLRQLKKKQEEIEERYRAVRSDMLLEIDRRHRAEQTLRALTGSVSTSASTYTISSSFPLNANPLSAPLAAAATTRIGEITLVASDSVNTAQPVVATRPADQNHFSRIALPRRFLRLE